MRTLAQRAQGCQNFGLAMTSLLPCRLKVFRALVITQSHSSLSSRVQYKAVSPPEKFLLWNPLPFHHHSLHLIGQLWSKSTPTPRGRATFLRKNPYFSNFWGSPASHLGKSSIAPLQPLLMRLSGCTVFLTGLLVTLWGKGNLQPPDPESPPQSTYRIPPYPSQSTKHRDHFSSTRRSLTAAPFPPYCLVAKSCPTANLYRTPGFPWFTISWRLFKCIFIESVILPIHLILSPFPPHLLVNLFGWKVYYPFSSAVAIMQLIYQSSRFSFGQVYAKLQSFKYLLPALNFPQAILALKAKFVPWSLPSYVLTMVHYPKPFNLIIMVEELQSQHKNMHY